MIVMEKKKEKKKRCAVFGCNDDRLFPEEYTLKFSFDKFNMAAVSVKRSVEACAFPLGPY